MLGISRFTSQNINGKVRITVQPDNDKYKYKYPAFGPNDDEFRSRRNARY